MIDSPIYDGSGKLSLAIAELCEVSPKNSIALTKLMRQAKDALNITTKLKRLPDNVKLDIYRWHYDRLQAVEIDSQPGIQPVETISQVDAVEINSQSIRDDAVEIFSQVESVNIVSQHESVEHYSQPETVAPVEIISQPTSNDTVEIVSQYDINALVRIAFYTVNKGVRVRQVIALDGFYINALMLATGIIKQDVPKRVQQAVDNWEAFDSALPITRQVKFLIIRELTAQLERLKMIKEPVG
jgi:hypothetical protein